MIQSSSATTNALSAGTVASSEFVHSEKDVERLKQQLQQNNYFDSTANANAADTTTATNMIDTTTTAATIGSSDGATTNPVYAKKWGKKWCYLIVNIVIVSIVMFECICYFVI